MTTTPKVLPTLAQRLKDLVEDNPLLASYPDEPVGPLHLSLLEGDPDSGVFIFVGDNASGKSLLVRVLAARLNLDKVEPLQVSMRYRTMSGMHRAFMFGSDEDESTGAVSMHAVKGGMTTCQGRTKPSWLMLDEPDIGLAHGYCLALGQYIGTFGNSLCGDGQKALGVVTHSKPLLTSMLKQLGHRPHVLIAGLRHQGMTLEQWLADDTALELDDLLSLNEKGHLLYREVENVLNYKPKED